MKIFSAQAWSWIAFGLGLVAALPHSMAAADKPSPSEQQRIEKWEPEIARFETQDLQQPPPTGAVLFVGSSTIKLWDTKAAFPEMQTINRGFGGSQLADTWHYLDRLVLKHKPRLVVIHAGGNDLNSGKPVQQVAKDFQAIVQRLRKELPKAQIIFIGIKPTIARKKLRDKERELNAAIREILLANNAGIFVEVDGPFSDEQGEPRADLLRGDKLHLNDMGYKVLEGLVRPLLSEQGK